MPIQRRRQSREYKIVNIYPTYTDEEDRKKDQDRLYQELETMALMRGFSSPYEYIQRVFSSKSQGTV